MPAIAIAHRQPGAQRDFKALQSRMKQPYDVIDSEGYVVKSFKNEGLAKSWISKQGYEAAPFRILGRKNREGKFTYEVIDPKSGQVTKSFSTKEKAIAYRDQRNKLIKAYPSYGIIKAQPSGIEVKDGKARGYAIRELKIGSKGFLDRVTQKEIIPSKDPYSDIYAEIDAAEAIKQLNKREPIDERTRYKLAPTREPIFPDALGTMHIINAWFATFWFLAVGWKLYKLSQQ